MPGIFWFTLKYIKRCHIKRGFRSHYERPFKNRGHSKRGNVALVEVIHIKSGSHIMKGHSQREFVTHIMRDCNSN
jgi:hypothetical protein